MFVQSEDQSNQAGANPVRVASDRRALVLLAIVSMLLHVPGLFVQGYDGEEGRRTLQAMEMVHEGHWVVPHVAGEPYLTKPPLYPWMIAGLATLVGEVSPWVARVPSLLATLGTGLLLLWALGRSLGARVGLVAAILWWISPAAGEKATLAETDPTLIFGVTLASCGLWLSRERSLGILLCALGTAIGTMVKGPPTFVFLGAFLIAMHRVGGGVPWKRALSGIALGTVPLIAWAMMIAGEQGGAATSTGWLDQLFGQGAFKRYFTDRLDLAVGVPLAALPAALSVPYLLRSEEKGLRTLGLAALIAFGFFLVSPRASARYVFPAVPWLAAGGAIWLTRKKELPRLAAPLLGLCLIFQLGRGITWFATPGDRALRPVAAAEIEDHLEEGEILYFTAPDHDLFAHLDHPVRKLTEKPPAGSYVFAKDPVEGWQVVQELATGWVLLTR